MDLGVSTGSERRRRHLVVASLVWAVLLGLVVLRYRPPPVVAADAPAEVFSAERAFAALTRLLDGIGPHPTGSEANETVRARLVAALRERGWEPTLQRARSCGRYGWCAEVVNVIARRSRTDAGPLVVLSAHYDSVPGGPGAADDGAGVAALLEVARVLAAEPAPREIVLLITDGEELGLVGAQAFMDEHPLAARARAVVNLEARGTAGPSILFRASEGALPAIEQYAARAPRPLTNSLASAVFSLMPNDTDLSVLLEGDRIGMDFAFIEAPDNYHAPTDDLTHLDRRSLQHQGDHALAAVRGLRDGDLAAGPPSVWADVLGLFVVGISQRWMLVLGALSLALCLAVAFARRRALQAAEVARAAAALVVGAAVAFAVGLALAFATAPPTPWATDPAAYVMVAHLLGALAFGAAGLTLRRCRPEAGALATITLFAAGTIALCLTLPGASYVLGAPALVGAVALTPVAFGVASARGAAHAASVAAALVLFPVGVLIYAALGHLALAAIAAVFFLALAPGLALFGADGSPGDAGQKAVSR